MKGVPRKRDAGRPGPQFLYWSSRVKRCPVNHMGLIWVTIPTLQLTAVALVKSLHLSERHFLIVQIDLMVTAHTTQGAVPLGSYPASAEPSKWSEKMTTIIFTLVFFHGIQDLVRFLALRMESSSTSKL